MNLDPIEQGRGSVLLDPVEVSGSGPLFASVRFLIGPDGKKVFIQRKGKAKFRSGRRILDLVEKGNRSVLLQAKKIGGAGHIQAIGVMQVRPNREGVSKKRNGTAKFVESRSIRSRDLAQLGNRTILLQLEKVRGAGVNTPCMIIIISTNRKQVARKGNRRTEFVGRIGIRRSDLA